MWIKKKNTQGEWFFSSSFFVVINYTISPSVLPLHPPKVECTIIAFPDQSPVHPTSLVVRAAFRPPHHRSCKTSLLSFFPIHLNPPPRGWGRYDNRMVTSSAQTSCNASSVVVHYHRLPYIHKQPWKSMCTPHDIPSHHGRWYSILVLSSCLTPLITLVKYTMVDDVLYSHRVYRRCFSILMKINMFDACCILCCHVIHLLVVL